MFYRPLLIPLFLQIALTFVVWLKMYIDRIQEMKNQKIDPQQLATSEGSRRLLIQSAASSDNFRNQFEMPVLFYIAVLLAVVLLIQDPVLVAFSWMFVALRYLHSLIHVTYNHVMHRFWVYVMSCGALLGLWARLATVVL